MYSTPRTEVRPPAMDRRPRIRPESRLIGAMPTRAAIWWRLMVPSSGNCVRSVRAVTSPIPGTDLSRASVSHQTGEALMACPMSLSSSGSFFLQEADVSHQPPGQLLVRGLIATVGLHADHPYDLPPPAHKRGEVPSLRLQQGPGRWSDAFGEEGNDFGVERVCLCQSAHRSGKVADLARVDDTERQPDSGQCCSHARLEATGSLQEGEGYR